MKEKGKKNLFVKNTKVAADFLIAILLIIISLVFFIEATKLPDKDLGLGPGEYPKFICICLFLLGLVQAVKSILMVRGIPIIDISEINKTALLRFSFFVLTTYLYYKLLKPIGFPIVTPFYLFFSIWSFGYKSKLKAALYSIVFTIIVYFLFTKVFYVMLPAGILG